MIDILINTAFTEVTKDILKIVVQLNTLVKTVECDQLVVNIPVLLTKLSQQRLIL